MKSMYVLKYKYKDTGIIIHMARSKVDQKFKDRGISFAKRLKEERQSLDMTQSELSTLANVPLDTLRSIENERVLSPGVFLAADLVHALGGKLDGWLSDISEKPTKAKRGAK